MDILKELINHFIKKTNKGPIFIYTQVPCFWDLDFKCGGSSTKFLTFLSGNRSLFNDSNMYWETS